MTSQRPSAPSAKSAPRVVVDTNVWVSGLINPAGAPGRVLDAARRGAITVVASWELADEITAVLSRPKLAVRYQITREDLADVVALLAPLLPTADIDVDLDIRGVRDVPVLAAAVAGNAQIIVTGDDDLHTDDVRTWLAAHDVEVLAPTALLARIGS